MRCTVVLTILGSWMEDHVILIVDDEELVLKALGRLFRGAGYRVITTESPREALEVLINEKISLILSDYKMRGMNGIELLQEAQLISPDTVRVLITGYSNAETAIQAINRGQVSRYIIKPWNNAELLLVIRDSLERYELEEERRKLSILTQEQRERLCEANNRLDLEHRRMQAILDRVAEGVVVTDSRGSITYANPSFVRMTGLPETDVIGADFPCFCCDGSVPAPGFDGEWTLSAGGAPLPVASSCSLLLADDDGGGSVHTVRDISREKEIDQLKANFFAMVIHDLRSPLLALIYRMTLKRKHLESMPESEEYIYVRDNEKAVRMLLDFVDHLLDISSLRSDKVVLNRELLRINSIVEVAAFSLDGLHSERGHVLEKHLTSDLPLIPGDRDRLTRVFINLLANAIKFTSPGGKITVSTSLAEANGGRRMIAISVSDSGEGISAEDLKIIFEIYCKGKGKKGSRELRSTGLGLAVCKGIVESHGGTIVVESEEGVGTTFRVLLPVDPVRDDGARVDGTD